MNTRTIRLGEYSVLSIGGEYQKPVGRGKKAEDWFFFFDIEIVIVL